MEAVDLTNKFFEELRLMFKHMLKEGNVSEVWLRHFAFVWDTTDARVRELIGHLKTHSLAKDNVIVG